MPLLILISMEAALCLYAIKRGEFTFDAQVLDHPWLDVFGHISWEDRCKDPAVLPQGLMEMLAYGYADDSEWENELISPILAEDTLIRHLPKTVIQTAEIDSLEVEGRAYAELLERNKVPVTFRCASGATHGFTEDYTPQAEEGRIWLLQALRSLLETE